MAFIESIPITKIKVLFLYGVKAYLVWAEGSDNFLILGGMQVYNTLQDCNIIRVSF